MDISSPTYLLLDLAGTFAFALNGALIALRVAHLDIVGVITLGMFTAVGGGMVRDLLLGDVPPASFGDWRYLAVAAGGGLVVFLFAHHLGRLNLPILWLDAAGLSLFAVSGAWKSLEYGVGPVQAVILGAVTACGGGSLRDVLIREVPAVLTSGLYAIPALLGALVLVVGYELGAPVLVTGMVAAGACFALRLVGIHFDLEAPRPPGARGATH